MRVIRRPAYQGHAVPSQAGYARSPFDPAITAPPRVVHDEPDPEPIGATAQNDYRGLALYRCSACGDLLTEDRIPGHDCAEG